MGGVSLSSCFASLENKEVAWMGLVVAPWTCWAVGCKGDWGGTPSPQSCSLSSPGGIGGAGSQRGFTPPCELGFRV